MATNYRVPGSSFGRDAMPLDAARAAFEWLLTGPHPVAIDGTLFPAFPDRPVPLNEVRDRLLHRRCPQSVRDAVWTHLVLLSRTEGGAFTVGCVGVALPGLGTIAATLSARFAGDRADVHAAVLTGFLTELARIDVGKPRIMLRLRWAAYRAGHACLREALDAPMPAGVGFRPSAPPPPWGHPDLVLARAVAETVITASEAELIGSTRLEDVSLAAAAAVRGISYEAVKKARQRAEHRLVAYLTEGAATESPARSGERDLADDVADTVIITDAARQTRTLRNSPSVTGLGVYAARRKRRRVSPRGRQTGVQGCGSSPTTPATIPPAEPVTAPGPSSEEPRCA